MVYAIVLVMKIFHNFNLSSCGNIDKSFLLISVCSEISYIFCGANVWSYSWEYMFIWTLKDSGMCLFVYWWWSMVRDNWIFEKKSAMWQNSFFLCTPFSDGIVVGFAWGTTKMTLGGKRAHLFKSSTICLKVAEAMRFDSSKFCPVYQ